MVSLLFICVGVQPNGQRPVVSVKASNPGAGEGTNLDLTCNLAGGRGTAFTWQKVGGVLPNNTLTRGNLLRYIPTIPLAQKG